MSERIVYERRARQTGTTVQIVDNRDGSFDSGDPNGWFTVCVEHGGVCSHETRRIAKSFAPVPREWCPTCQEEEVEHIATATRRGGGWGFRCSCGEEPNRSHRHRRVAERWAKDHERSAREETA